MAHPFITAIVVFGIMITMWTVAMIACGRAIDSANDAIRTNDDIIRVNTNGR